MKNVIYERNTELKKIMEDKFLCSLPFYIESPEQFDPADIVFSFLDGLERFDYNVRNFISGIEPTLHSVLSEIDLLKSSGLFRLVKIETAMEIIEEDIIGLELYELMIRFEHTKKEVVKACGSDFKSSMSPF